MYNNNYNNYTSDLDSAFQGTQIHVTKKKRKKKYLGEGTVVKRPKELKS